MRGAVTILNGSMFAVTGERGDVDHGEHGFYAADTRFLSRWVLRVDGQAPDLVSVAQPDHFSASFFLSLDRTSVYAAPRASLIRARIVHDTWLEEITLLNHSDQPLSFELELTAASDFADLFEVKDQAVPLRGVTVEHSDRGVCLHYRRGGFERRTEIGFDRPPTGGCDGVVSFRIDVPPRGSEVLRCEVVPFASQPDWKQAPRARGGSLRETRRRLHQSLSSWLADVPLLETDWAPLQEAYRASIEDLGALRFTPDPGEPHTAPAAGLPWFMTLFGRDSLLTSYQALPFLPSLAAGTLRLLAEHQSDRFDDFRDAEPGKIMHEVRRGERTSSGAAPFSPYYGTVDATPLFLIVLDEYERWTGDRELVRELEPVARAALTWIERHGDTNGDGFVDYERRNTRSGLVNQCWKDSWNSIVFADGRLAAPPIATCEVQGYVYDAQLRTARLADEVWGDSSLATELRRCAAALRTRFHERFLLRDPDGVALALDGTGARVDARTSNPGHLLWSGLLDDELADSVAGGLLAGPLHSGWGIRTMAADEVAYNPLEYHNGTVWPHDNALISAGLARYGRRDDANQIAVSLLRAASGFGGRLPEVFAGYPAQDTGVPVEYPTSSRPQAWAAAAPLLLLRTILGLDAREGELHAAPHLPPEIGRIELRGVRGPWGARDVTGLGDPALARFRGALNSRAVF